MKSEKNSDITCRRCGTCCHVDMVAYVSPEDFHRWEKEQRHDIVARLSNNEVLWAGDRIINKFGAKMTQCVCLNWGGSSFSCEIYETRPVVCRNFAPGSSELCPLFYRKG